ncbi:phage tail tape measure protein [Clostridium sp. KNHs214]|uniref:phage tail tape measure protein n=1 Tax=Clostridium sp. KNHs214 TaxID=1540257 RepID=UPI00054F044B|nr:phage tail tape measure protein [Clostridium sp. KNHs214]
MAYGIKTKIDEQSSRKTLNDFDRLIKQIKQASENNTIDIKFKGLNNEAENINRHVKGISNNFKGMESSIGTISEFFVKWSIASKTISFVVSQLKSGIQEIIDINKSNVNTAMITGQSVKDVEKMNMSYLNIAQDLGVLNKEVVTGAESWRRSGASLKDVNDNLITTSKLSKIAGMDTAQMADQLITINKQYNLGSKGLKNYASNVALLDNVSTTSSEKINTAMQYSSQTFKEYGFGIQEALALITNASEQSARSGSSLGRGFVSMLTNFTKVQDAVKNGDKETTDAINKSELLLSKKGIALRKNADEFRNIGDVIQDISKNINKFSQKEREMLAFNLGGKENKELFLSTINNMERVNELQNKIKKDSSGKALDDSYNKSVEELEFKINNLKNSITEFWMKALSSNTIKRGVDDIKTVIDVVSYLTIENKKLGVSYMTLSIGSLLMVKNFGKIKFAIGEVIAFMQLLKTEGLATFALLNLNPAVLAITAVVAVIATATYAITKHVKHQKELEEQIKTTKNSYKDLTQAIKENNNEMLKQKVPEFQKMENELKAAIKEKKEADKILNTYKSNSMNMLDSGGYAQARASVDLANKKLEEQIGVLKKAKIAFDETTGEIKGLAQAENLLKANNLADSIKKKEEAKLKELDKTLELINSYQNLNREEKKSATQKAELGTLALQLKDRINGLRIATDEHGNTVIVNTDLLAREASMIDTEKGAVINSTNARLASAKDDYTIEVGKTKVVYSEVSKRISMYQAEADALRGLATKYEQADKLIRVGLDDNNPLKKKQNPLSEMLSGRAKELDKESSALSDAKKKIDEAFSKKTPGISDIGSSSGGGGGSGYMPPSGGDDKKKKKAKSDADKRKREAEEAERKRKEALKKALDDAINQYDYAIKTIENKIANARNRMELYTEDGDKAGNRVSLMKDIEKFTKEKMAQLEAKKRFIQNSINSGKYEADTVKDLKSKLLDIDGTLSDVYTSLKKIKMEIIDETYKQKTVEITKELEKLKDKMEEIDSADTFNKQKLNYMDSMIEKLKQQRSVTQSYVNELEKQMRATRDIATRSALEDSIKKYRKELQSLQIEIIKSMTDRKNLIKDLTFEIEKIDQFNRVIEETNNNLKKHNFALADLELQIEMLKESFDISGVSEKYNKYIEAMKQKTIELKNQSSALSQSMTALQVEFKAKFNVDISGMSKKELTDLYQKLFATRVTNSKEEKEALEEQAELFKQLVDDYWQLIDAIQENKEAIGGINNEIIKKQKEQADYILNIQKEIQDKTKEMMLKGKDDEKKILDERLKNFKEFIDKRQKELDKTWKQEDYDRDLQKKKEEEAKLIAEIESKRRVTDLQGQAEVKRLQDELKKIQEDIANFEQQHNRDKIMDNYDKQAEQIDKEYEEANKKLDEFYSEENLNQMSKDAMQNGWFKDIHGNVIMLKDAMIDYIKTTSDGLSVIGQKIQDEIILKLAQIQIFVRNGLNLGGTSNIGTPISNPIVMNPINGGIGGNGNIDIGKLIGGSIGNIQPVFNNPVMPMPIMKMPMNNNQGKEIKIYVDSINRFEKEVVDTGNLEKMIENGVLNSKAELQSALNNAGYSVTIL